MLTLDSIGITATAPGATGAAFAAVTNDSLTVKHCKGGRADIAAIWCDFQGGGFIQVNWPTAHDVTRGWRARVVASEVTARNVLGLRFPVNEQETMTVLGAGSATAGDVENGVIQLIYPEGIPGVAQNMISWSQLKRRAAKERTQTTVDFTIDVTAGGAWNGSELINADSDLLIANREYAVLGIEFGVECCAIGIRGADTGNLRLAVPGSIEFADLSHEWFALLSRAWGDEATIPVINSANKSATFLDALQDENIADVTGSLILVLLD